jgi:hypothetical protein
MLEKTNPKSERDLSVSFTFLFLLLISIAKSQTTFYDVNTIQKIEISFTQSNWDYQMDTAKAGSEGYLMASTVKVNGVIYDSVGVKYKGNSSYNSTYTKNPLHISLSEYKNQNYQGVKDIKLSNCFADPSMIREVLAYDILKNYMDCPQSNFAQVYINGNYIGVYSSDESINKSFCASKFYSASANSLLKCNPIVNPTTTTKCNLKYINSDSTSYMNYYEVKSTYGWKDLVKLCDTVTNYSSFTENKIDMDRFIWMLAYNNVLINLDSYTGAFCQNYYLFKDNTQHFNPIVWDLNMAFGGFANIGVSNTSLGSLTVTNMQQLPLNIHATDVYWPMINTIMANATYKRKYIAHIRTIFNEYFANNLYVTRANQLQSIIDTAVQSDQNKFFSYTQFQNGLTSNAIFGSNTIPGISVLMNARMAYLQNTAEFQATQPTINSIVSSVLNPVTNSTVTITAQVTNTNNNSVFLYYRSTPAIKFFKIQMLDDGAHNDGAAGDNVYGAAMPITSLQTQYYLYAENSNAGIFSPQRAEHEFYTLLSAISSAAPGQIVINEFLASNQSDTPDEYGAFGDWIELYNTTSSPILLSGLYISDNYNNSTKFALPTSEVIAANGYKILFADGLGIMGNTYIHTNFNLSASGEQIMLSNYNNVVLDSVSFGAQSQNVSMGRCPNGTGAFIFLNPPSFAVSNCLTSVDEIVNQTQIFVYPNPTSSVTSITINGEQKTNNIALYNAFGQVLINFISTKKTEQIDLSIYAQGVYFLKVNNDQFQKIIKTN